MRYYEDLRPTNLNCHWFQVLQLINERPNICKQIHLPAQSGNNEVLERMRRGYTRESYLNLVSHIQKVVPGEWIVSVNLIKLFFSSISLLPRYWIFFMAANFLSFLWYSLRKLKEAISMALCIDTKGQFLTWHIALTFKLVTFLLSVFWFSVINSANKIMASSCT